MKKHVTWVLVADHQHGRVLSNEGPDRGLRPVNGMSFRTRLPTDRELVTDRLPRSMDGHGGGRHAMEPRVDPHRQEAERFVARVSRAISAAAQRGQFDRLVLVAPPRALGELRRLLPERVLAMVIGESDRDLTKASVDSIRAHVAQFMAV
jgi:protein required for attachment to host cells